MATQFDAYPPGPVQALTFLLDGVLLGGKDDAGRVWHVDNADAWWTSAGVSQQLLDRVTGDGVWAGPVRRGGKVIPLRGVCYCPDLPARVTGTDLWQAVCSDGEQLYELEVTDVDGTRDSAFVQLAVAPFARVGTDLAFEFGITLFCPDGVRIGEEQSASTGLPANGGGLTYPLTYPLDYGATGSTGQVSVTNTGTAATPVLYVVEGPLPDGFEVSSDGVRHRYLAEVGAGQSITVDSADGTVLLDGSSDRRANLIVDDWFTVPAGQSKTFQFTAIDGSTAPAASMTVSIRPRKR